MRILKVHNYYQQPGGEDQSFAAEVELLQIHNHQVFCFTRHNDEIKSMSNISIACKTLWNHDVYRALLGTIRETKPDIVHFENTFPLISPSAYYAARKAGVPIIQSLRNYRLFCANSFFLRDGKVCEDCLGKIFPYPALYHRCYRNNRLATGVVVALQVFHRLIRTWQRTVDRYIALTEFARSKYVEAGLPENKIVVKPNFITNDPGMGMGDGYFALFVGRLSVEKGITTLLSAWNHLSQKIPLWIAGDGPLRSMVETAARQNPLIIVTGRKTPTEVLELMKKATMLLFPSLWFEGLPRVIIEAYAVGLPIVASNLGSMTSLIDHGNTGLHFRPGDPQDLVEKVEFLLRNHEIYRQMRLKARNYYKKHFTSDKNYQILMQIYNDVLQGPR